MQQRPRRPSVSAGARLRGTVLVCICGLSWACRAPAATDTSAPTATSSPAATSGPAGPSAPVVSDAEATALEDFQQRLAAYVALRERLARDSAPLTSIDDAVELADRQTTLATAIRAARASAQPGDLIPALVATRITATVTADLSQRPMADKQAAFEEVPLAAVPGINGVYPADAALATVPPLLLNRLPRLPDNLQYRFYDRHILILDGDTDLILDYLLDVLPPLAQGDPEH